MVDNEQVQPEAENIPEENPEASQPKEEQQRIFTQAELDKIVGKEKLQVKQQAYAKGRQDAMNELQQQQNPQQQPMQQQQDNSLAGVTDERLRQMIAEQSQHLAQQQHLNQIQNDFAHRVASVSGKYDDFNELVSPIINGQAAIPLDVQALANSMDNTGDICMELLRNPEHIGKLRGLMADPSTQNFAYQAMQKLSNSIKTNEAAKTAKATPEPLSQLEPSYTSSDNGSYTVSDYKKMDWMRR